jgi:hypothetical protein
MITIAILNESTVLTDAQVDAVVPALQKQVTHDFCPAWKLEVPTLKFIPKNQIAPLGAWQLVVLNASDQAGALGYHDLTPDGLPLSKVFSGDDIADGVSWSVTMSHELLEMLGDPNINLTALVQQTAKKGRLFAYEACDPTEDDSFGYLIDSVLVSDFVLPSWFVPGAQGHFDHHKKLSSPLHLLPGGYISVMDLTSKKGWTQITAENKLGGKPIRPGSRRERRIRGQSNWKVSTAVRNVGTP